MKNQSNELDLAVLFTSIYRFFHKNIKLLLGFLLLGVALGFLYNSISKPYYESSAYATSALSYFETEEVDYRSKKIVLDQQAMVDIINDLSQLVKNNEFDVVARKTNLSEEVAKSIRFVEAEELFYVDGDNIQQKRDKFKVTLQVYDNIIIPQIQKGIEYYINQNTYIQKHYQLYLDQSSQLIDRIAQEIDDLKEVRAHVGRKSSGDYSEIKLSSQFAQTDNQIINLYIKQQQITKYTLLLKPIEFFGDLAMPEKPVDRLSMRLGIMSSLFFLMAIFISLVKYFNSRISKEK
tara:strand:- start:857 stop:1732 length:876 start_codon:yes stop_codon:yes gene_type:complete